jgi:hypothetical protein
MRIKIALLGMLAAGSAHAATIDFGAPILGPDDQPTHMCADEKNPECQKTLTLGRVAASVLWSGTPDERDQRGVNSLKPEDAIHRSELAMKINKGGTVDVKAEDIALIKQLVGKTYPPLTIMRVYELLDPASK